MFFFKITFTFVPSENKTEFPENPHKQSKARMLKIDRVGKNNYIIEIMIKKMIPLLLVFFCFSQLNAQQLLSPSGSFSTKKTSYITLKDGTEIKGTAKIKLKKMQIKSIEINDGTKKRKLAAKDINCMYLPPSGLDKLVKAIDFLTDAQKWSNEKLNNDLIDQGYVYFESTDVKIKKKTYTLMMQLLNPSFSKSVKVYYDPKAKKTASLGVGGLNVVGGNAKSYYVKKEGEPVAYLLTDKNYKKEFSLFWKGCNAIENEYTAVKWTELPKHIITYSEKCAK